jgi:hypothetical protein
MKRFTSELVDGGAEAEEDDGLLSRPMRLVPVYIALSGSGSPASSLPLLAARPFTIWPVRSI